MNKCIKNTALTLLASIMLSACGSSNSGHSGENANQTAQMTQLKTQLEEVQQKATTAAEKAKNQQNELQITTEELTKAKHSLAQREAELNAANEKVKLKTTELDATQKQKAQAEQALNAANNRLQTLQKQHDDLAEKKAAAENALTTTQTELARLQQQHAETAAQLSEARNTKEKAERDLAQATTNLATAQSEVAEAKSQLEAEKTAKTKAEAELTKLQKVLSDTVAAAAYWEKKWRYLGFDKGMNIGRVTIGRTAIDIDLSGYPISNDVIEKAIYHNHAKVGTLAFINQAYSSYTAFLPEASNTQRYSGSDYVFLPTDSNADIFNTGITAIYQGKALERNYEGDGNNITTADFMLTADFANKTVQGSIMNRTNNRSDIQLHQTAITNPVSNGYFNMPYIGFSGTATTPRKSGGERTGRYEGFFAGPNAEEVIGAVDGLAAETTFGGKR